MISGKNLKPLLPALMLVMSTQAADTSAPALEDIFSPLKRPLEMSYREEKNLEILNQTLTSSGRLRFIPPDTLEREVNGWRDRVYRMEGNRIIISDGDKVVRQLDLWSSPELAGFATTLRALLAADIETLKKHYDLTLSGRANGWSLLLIPRSKPLSQLIDRISINGDKQGIREFRTYEQGGNHTRLVLLPDE